MRPRVLETGSLFGAASSAMGSAAASICCVGPLGVTLLGVQGAIFAAGLKPYRWYLLGGSAVLLGFAYLMIYRPLSVTGASCSTRIGRWNRITFWTSTGIWITAIVIQFVADWLGY